MLSHDFLNHAKRCLDLAEEVDDPPTRDELIAIADRWTRLAEEAGNALRRQSGRQPEKKPQYRASPD
jgi:hypothetical protein